jgi:hypothetical protein
MFAKHPRSPKLVVFSLLLILFTLSVSFMFVCKHCTNGFTAVSAGGLRRHQTKCEAFQKHEDGANHRRKATASSNKAKRATKLKDRKMRLNSAAPLAGVSLFVIIDKYHG